MQDGFTQVGAGQDDRRLAGEDLQHYVQPRGADEMHEPVRMVRQTYAQGGPMKEMMQHELDRHSEAKEMRVKHLEDHYKR